MTERPFPPGWTGVRRFLWRLIPLRVRSRWSPYDNWLRGYDAGWRACLMASPEDRALSMEGRPHVAPTSVGDGDG